METAALTPPPWLEAVVTALTPPPAREAVLGDLFETYASPRQYVLEAARTLPLVIASHVRRNANLPALLLQGALLQTCFGMTAAMIALPLLLLRDGFAPMTRPSPRWALRQAVLAAFIGIVALQMLSQHSMSGADHNVLVWVELFFIAPAMLPVLGLLRTGLIVEADRRPLLTDHLSADDLAVATRAFATRLRRRHWIEACALALAAAFLARGSAMLAGCFAAAALYLAFEGLAATVPQGDFTTLRAGFSRALARQQQTRRFLVWLWLAPLLLALQDRFIQAGLVHGQPMTTIQGVAGVTLLCFLAAALTREHGGRMREQISLLEHMHPG